MLQQQGLDVFRLIQTPLFYPLLQDRGNPGAPERLGIMVLGTGCCLVGFHFPHGGPRLLGTQVVLKGIPMQKIQAVEICVRLDMSEQKELKCLRNFSDAVRVKLSLQAFPKPNLALFYQIVQIGKMGVESGTVDLASSQMRCTVMPS